MKGLIAIVMSLLAIPMSCMFCVVPPKNLGVHSTQSDYQTYVSTGGWQISELKPGSSTGQGTQGGQGGQGGQAGQGSQGTQGVQMPGQEGKTIQFSGTREVKATRTSEQLTALANSADLKAWKYYPFQSTQIRVNSDGSVEASGKLLSDRVFTALARPGLDMTDEERGVVNDYGKYIKGNPAVYIKFNGGVTNNSVNVNFSKVEVGGISIPSDVMGEVNSHVKDLVERKMVKVPGLNIKSLTFQNGKMNFDGTVPDKIYVQH
ncbi:MAG: hypothetical protein NTV42_09000 [Chloroflexi bacterium]|nr:hypothetical protein [Chloroflexota bacterium]